VAYCIHCGFRGPVSASVRIADDSLSEQCDDNHCSARNSLKNISAEFQSDLTPWPAPSGSTRTYHAMVKPVGAICNIDCTYCYYLHKEKLLGSKSKCQITDEILETHIRQCGGVLNAGTMTISSSTTSSNFAFLTCSRDVATRPAGASTMATRRVEPETPTAERKPVRWCPLIAVLSLLATVVLVMLSIPDIINRMGNLTVWSAGVFLCTLIFPIASLAALPLFGERARIMFAGPSDGTPSWLRLHCSSQLRTLPIGA